MKTNLILVTLLAALLSGCTDSSNKSQDAIIEDVDDLASGKGAINGLLIDDAYRPIADATVFLFPLGLERTTTLNGEFQFADLVPDAYEILVDAPGHESAQVPVQVVEGVFTDAEVEARRVVNDGGRIITTEYSVFVPCAASAPAITTSTDCTSDASGETYRAGFNSDFTQTKNITYLITEMLADNEASSTNGALKLVVRERGNGQYYANGYIANGNYLRFQMPINGTSLDDTENRNFNWTNDRQLETVMFPQGAFKEETQDGQDAACSAGVNNACFESRGVGARFGVRAQILQSLFIDEPDVDIDTYCVLCPS